MAFGRFARRGLAGAGVFEGTFTGPQAMLGSLETCGIEFKTDEVAAGIEASDGGSARSHTTVKHQLSGIGVGFDQVFKQRQWLLGVVDGVGLGRYMQHAAGIAEAGILGNGSAEVPARVGIVAGLASALVRLALLKLRMVRWGAVAENQGGLDRERTR